jgi:hypothetical protein
LWPTIRIVSSSSQVAVAGATLRLNDFITILQI